MQSVVGTTAAVISKGRHRSFLLFSKKDERNANRRCFPVHFEEGGLNSTGLTLTQYVPSKADLTDSAACKSHLNSVSRVSAQPPRNPVH
jgi:hypothetical protein